MVKFVVIFQPKEGTDPEEIWKYWEEEHAPFHAKAPGLIKYGINRVTQTVAGDTDRMWGMAEEWYDSLESFNAARAAHQADPEIQKKIVDWNNRLAWKQSCLVEEKVIFER